MKYVVTRRLELEHDPEKWIPVFGKRSCSKKKLERDDDSKKSHHALMGELHGVISQPFGVLYRRGPGMPLRHFRREQPAARCG
jgi:hypothetical protein